MHGRMYGRAFDEYSSGIKSLVVAWIKMMHGYAAGGASIIIGGNQHLKLKHWTFFQYLLIVKIVTVT